MITSRVKGDHPLCRLEIKKGILLICKTLFRRVMRDYGECLHATWHADVGWYLDEHLHLLLVVWGYGMPSPDNRVGAIASPAPLLFFTPQVLWVRALPTPWG